MHEHGTNPFLMPPLMDGIRSKRSSQKDGQINMIIFPYLMLLIILKRM
jgi:hypothetical protein